MDYFEREERRRRIVGWIMFAVLVLLIVFGCMRNCRKGIVLGSEFVYRRSDTFYSNDYVQATVAREGETTLCDLTYYGYSQSATINATGNRYEGNPEYQVTLSNGSVVTGYLSAFGHFYNGDWPMESVVYVDNSVNKLPDHWVARYAMNVAFGELETNGSGWFVFFGALIYGLGMLFWLFPEQMHELGNIKNIMYQDASLTADGEVMVQIGGILIMILGALLALRLFPGL